jgi:hypothetical protein
MKEAKIVNNEQFVLAYGRRYRKPHPIPFNKETFEKMEAISLDLSKSSITGVLPFLRSKDIKGMRDSPMRCLKPYCCC